jgi:hypothetical protein
VQEAALVLVDLDTRVEQLSVHRARGEVQQQVLDPALEQQHDAHAAPRGLHQGPAEPPARQEVGVGDEHFALRAADQVEIAALDVAPMAQAVAHDEGRAVAIGERQRRRGRRILGRGSVGHARPEAQRCRAHLRGERPFDAHRVVQARRRRRGRVEVVEDVDSADERDAAVDAGELAVHAAQAVAAQREQAHRPVGVHLPAGARQRAAEALRVLERAETVDQQAHVRAARRRAHQRVVDEAAGLIVGEDVGLEQHLLARGVDRGRQRGEVLLAVAEQRQPVAADEAHRFISA